MTAGNCALRCLQMDRSAWPLGSGPMVSVEKPGTEDTPASFHLPGSCVPGPFLPPRPLWLGALAVLPPGAEVWGRPPSGLVRNGRAVQAAVFSCCIFWSIYILGGLHHPGPGGGGVPLHPEVAEGASRGQSHQWQEHEGSKRLFPIHLSQEPENYEVSVSPDFHCPPHDHRRFW